MANDAQWDDADHPQAYLITFRTYGTWLHGDARGSIDRYHNKYNGPRVPANKTMHNQHAARLKGGPVTLDARQRPVVEAAIREVCCRRGWSVLAINIRTNHIHVVVFVGRSDPERVLRDFKAYSTRALRIAGLWTFEHSPWVDGGSRRYLWRGSNVAAACDYVINGQGEDLPESF